MNANTNLQPLAQKLEALEAELNSAIASTRRKNILGLGLSVAIVMFTIGYLTFAYKEFAKVNPEFAADLAQARVESALPEMGAQLEKALKENAPSIIAEGEKRLLAVPDQVMDELNGRALAEIDANMPEVENKVYNALRETLDDPAAKGIGSDEARFQALLNSLNKKTVDHIVGIYGQYTQPMHDIMGYLEELGNNERLDKRQQLHRAMVSQFLTLAREYDKHPQHKEMKLTAVEQ